MSSTTYRGVIKEGRVILQQPSIPLADGTEVLVTPIPAEPGTPAAVLAAMAAGPHVPQEWVDDLERLIAEGQQPPSREDPFAGESPNREAR